MTAHGRCDLNQVCHHPLGSFVRITQRLPGWQKERGTNRWWIFSHFRHGGAQVWLNPSQSVPTEKMVARRKQRPSSFINITTAECFLSEEKRERERKSKQKQDGTHEPGCKHSENKLCLTLLFFFSRVRTPCGHGAQVIIEGRKKQSDGGERNKDNPTTKTQTTANQSPQAESPPSCSLSSVLR